MNKTKYFSNDRIRKYINNNQTKRTSNTRVKTHPINKNTKNQIVFLKKQNYFFTSLMACPKSHLLLAIRFTLQSKNRA